MKITKKLSIFITIFVLIFGVQFVQPKKAYAQITDIPQFLKEFGIDTLITILQNRILNKLVDDAVNWANGGFDGDPGFISNWDDFLEGTKHDVLANALYSTTEMAYDAQNKSNEEAAIKRQECESTAIAQYYLDVETMSGKEAQDKRDLALAECEKIHGGTVYGDVGTVAEENYHSYMNTGVIDARSAAATVAKYGAKALNVDALDSLINRRGNTIFYLLGSQENVDNFKTEFRFGGWEGYMALADPHNYAAGVNSMLENLLKVKTRSETSEVNQAADELQNPTDYHDKRECLDWDEREASTGTNADGTETFKKSKICLKYETVTPANLVEENMREVMTKDTKQSYLARELSDVLAKALGRLTDGLLQVGISKLSDKFSKDKEGEGDPDNVFAGIYQNQYDVLGIADDARIFNEGEDDGEDNGDGENPYENPYNKEAGDDASTPYIGGPEDIEGFAWNEGPELIIELKGNLNKALKLSKKSLTLLTEISKTQKSVNEIVPLLDYCRPGPDYGWQQRYNDISQDRISEIENIDTEDSCKAFKREIEQKHRAGLNDAKKTTSDSLLNIPGIYDSDNIINFLLSDENQELIKQKNDDFSNYRSMYQILLRMKIEVENKEEYLSARDVLNEKIPLFVEDIYTEEEIDGELVRTNKLSNEDLIEILNIKIILEKETGIVLGLNRSGNRVVASVNEEGVLEVETTPLELDEETMSEQYFIEYKNLHIFKEQPEGESKFSTEREETPESLVTDNREKAEGLVISFGWNIWRSAISNAEYRKYKSNLRYEYYLLENKLVTEKNILELKIELEKTENTAMETENYSKDCIVFLNRITDNEGVYNMTDREIKTMLEAEYEKQQSGTESIFKTDIYTSPSNIELSILGFVDGEQTISEYKSTVYRGIGEAANIGESINALLELDQTYRTVILEVRSNQEGIYCEPAWANLDRRLFCQTETSDWHGECNAVKHRMCFASCTAEYGQTWQFANSLIYRTAFSGI